MANLRRLHLAIDLLTVVLFGAGISLALIGAIIHRHDIRSEIEKRGLAIRPNLTLGSWFSNQYQPAMEKYLSDRFGGRTTLVRWNANLHVSVLQTSSNHIVTVGRGGWLLYAGEQALAPYQPDQPPPADVASWVARAQTMRDELRQRGIPFMILVVPNPPTVAKETLPAGYRISSSTNLSAFISAAIDSGLNIINPTADLVAARSLMEVYETTDSHWNAYGALVATNTLLRGIHAVLPSVNPWPAESFHVVRSSQSAGDLAAALGLGGMAMTSTVELQSAATAQPAPIPEYGLRLQQVPRAFTTNDTSRPRAVIFRDSYANAMMPYLNESFSRIVYVRSRLVIPEVIAAEKPDIVIMEIVERYLPDIGTPSTRESENGIAS